LVTLRGGGDGDGYGESGGGGGKEEVVIGMMGSHHWGEVGYLFDPGMFFLDYYTQSCFFFF